MALATFFCLYLGEVAVLRIVMWLIKSAKILLVVFVVMAILTPFVVQGLTGIHPERGLTIGLAVAMSEPPTSFEEEMSGGDAYSLYMGWLFLLQFLGWLIVPILVGIIVQQGYDEIQRQREALRQEEERLRKREEHLEDIRRRMRELLRERYSTALGLAEEEAGEEVEDIFQQWSKLLARIEKRTENAE